MRRNVVAFPTKEQFTIRDWGKERDPMIEHVCALVLTSGHTIPYIAEISGVSDSTIRNWLVGKTKRPQQLTMKFVLRAIGYDIGIFKL